MNFGNHKKKTIGLIGALLFTVTGTYNAVVINSESSIPSHEMKFVKRLDEVYGVIKPGRMVAASKEWRKLGAAIPVKSRPAMVQEVRKIQAAPAAAAEQAQAEPAIAAVQEDLQLNLVEVVNPKKWQKGLPAGQFFGSLTTNNGIIEDLNVGLPNGEGIAVSFSEMTGNVFEYDIDGELYSGMMYQVDQHTYMVTLSNGPLEGTRMRFTQANSELPPAQEQMAENNIEPGSFGHPDMQAPEQQPEALVQNDQQFQAEGLQVQQGYNFEQNQAM